MIPRSLKLPAQRSCFVLGPRQTGKSTLVQALLGPTDLAINLLSERTLAGYLREPGRFQQEVRDHAKRHPTCIVLVDEIQRLPQLLNEVHELIETNRQVRFVLTGSSARKLKRGASNLLAGRARLRRLYPLTATELGEAFSLERALRSGCLPWVWAASEGLADEIDFLHSYVDVYLREEIREEGALRNLGPFVRLLELAALQDGELVNYTSLARDCGVSTKTVQAYYQILEDTFLVYRLEPWLRGPRRRMVAHPRFYFFDTGVTNALCQVDGPLNTRVRGRRFKQFVVTQATALNAYQKWGVHFYFWRTREGAEVDLLMARGERVLAAIELKAAAHVTAGDAHGLRRLGQDYPEAVRLIACTAERPYLLAGTDIRIVPWMHLLDEVLPEIAASTTS